MPSRTLSLAIPRHWRQVWRFASEPHRLVRWAPGLCRSVRRAGGTWRIGSPFGVAGFRWAPGQRRGGLDHLVMVAGQPTIRVPMRVLPLPRGTVVQLGVTRTPGMSLAAYHRDQRLVAADLRRLRREVERLPW